MYAGSIVETGPTDSVMERPLPIPYSPAACSTPCRTRIGLGEAANRHSRHRCQVPLEPIEGCAFAQTLCILPMIACRASRHSSIQATIDADHRCRLLSSARMGGGDKPMSEAPLGRNRHASSVDFRLPRQHIYQALHPSLSAVDGISLQPGYRGREPGDCWRIGIGEIHACPHRCRSGSTDSRAL